MTVEELLAREEIRDLVARYNSYGDAGKFDLLLDLFADDAELELTDPGGDSVPHTGRDAIEAVFTGTSSRVLARETAAVPYIRHFTSTHQIDLVGNDRATGRCYFAVIVGSRGGAGGLDHWGRYLDDYVRVEGRWRFARRRAVTDGHAASGWFAGSG